VIRFTELEAANLAKLVVGTILIFDVHHFRYGADVDTQNLNRLGALCCKNLLSN
jgi:hypothetical protein